MSSRVACSCHIFISQVSLWGGYIGVPVQDRVMIGSRVPCVVVFGCWREVGILGAGLICLWFVHRVLLGVSSYYKRGIVK